LNIKIITEKKFKKTLFSLFLFSIICPVLINAQTWCDSSWDYRKTITVNESYVDFTNYPIIYTVNHEGNANADCSDIRVTDNCTALPFGLRNCNSTHVELVTQFNLTETVDNTFYIYYGNPSADFLNTTWNDVEWNVWDTFDDASIDYTKWGLYSNKPAQCSITETSGYLRTLIISGGNIACGVKVLTNETGLGFKLEQVYIETRVQQIDKGNVNEHIRIYSRVDSAREANNASSETFTDHDDRKTYTFSSSCYYNGTGYPFGCNRTQIPYNLDYTYHIFKIWNFRDNLTYEVWQGVSLKGGNSSYDLNWNDTSKEMLSQPTYGSADIQAFVVHNDGGNENHWDWIYVKQYIEPEPVLSFSVEEPRVPPSTTTTLGDVGRTLQDVGEGTGNLFRGISTPLTVFIIFLSLATGLGFAIAKLGEGLGAKV
jgi:hypothetical protein